MTKWTIESAKAYVTKVQKGKQSMGLKFWSAVDFLTKETTTSVSTSVEVPLENNDDDNTD